MIKRTKPYTITLGQLRDALRLWPDDTEVYFGAGDLAFYRTKQRRQPSSDAPALVQIEFDQIYQITHEPD